MARPEISEIIDLETYPIDRPGTAAYDALLARGREALDSRSLFSMAGFLRPSVAPAMARELDSRLPVSVRYERMRGAYIYGADDERWPENHPRRQRHRCAYNQVLNYQIGNDSPLRDIYYWQPLTDFLRELCGYPTFFRSDCPHLALTAKIAREGDTDGWHYDTNDVVFSLLLQAPEAGGEFEYAPGIRDENDEKYEAVAALFADPAKRALRPPMRVGDFNVFRGDLSMHRVTPVRGARSRIVALYCYDRNPGMRFDQCYIDELNQGLPS